MEKVLNFNPNNAKEMKRDFQIFDLIEKEHQRQLKGIELIASENFVSDQVMEAMAKNIIAGKYLPGAEIKVTAKNGAIVV